ncbi:MerR family transcriptional regulator [Myceligenerans pegani]|uniref:MerR family transcriptional regulator n=1 Tax=Myceligenerans pegani TaxID=2776917 RepID=A0ABR9N155_9MICO|nr:MerR family transcriptional regulator [Myceligenerans sp. TRM 65318]MBE1876803.1 MerR family transcriptional regulator [Myceligenerans sp. TRM 65318]MBE3019074.1 MerR family transcriptional regulator [Myceligenerans sp. TRM 65318]
MRIGDLAARSGVSVRSLRYYEEQGLLASTRSAGGQRTYDDDAPARVEFLQRLYAAGLSSRTIAEVLPCVETPSRENTEDAFLRLRTERDRLSERIEDLTRTRDALDGLIEANRRHASAIAS